MYGKKAIYFNYKSYGAFIGLMFIPALLVLFGGSMAYMFLSIYPIFFGVGLGALIAFPGLPRLMAINSNAALKLNQNKKALRKIRTAVRLPFAPISAHIFHAYVEIINGNIKIASEIISEIEKGKLSYSEKAKQDAIQALIIWKSSENPEAGLKYLEDKDRKGADEAILYVKGLLMNIVSETADARKYNEEAFRMDQANRDILSNIVISYSRTGQDRDAKIMFRTLYQDMVATSDALCFMAKIKEKENKKPDAREFIEKALEIESSDINIVSKEELKKYLAELQREEI